MGAHRDLRSLAASQWQLTAVTCLILACKFLERDDNVPLIQDLLRVLLQPTGSQASSRLMSRSSLPHHITYEQVCSNELELMARMGWDLFKVTPQNFLD